MRTLRRVVQLAFLGLTLVVGYGVAAGWFLGSVEGYCPMGGLAALPSALGTRQFACSTGEGNFTALAALVLLALLARKSFCSWLCPLGTVLEWLGRLGARLRGRRGARPDLGLVAPPRAPDRLARWLRLGVLAAIVGATYASAELLFRPYCPYYSLTSFHGHDVVWWSYAVLGGVLLSALIVPMAWCRYLCPLGGALWPFARVASLRVSRAEAACTGCGRCDRACPHGLQPSRRGEVRSGECTLCLECTAACPEPGALAVRARAPGVRPRVASWAVPGLLGSLIALVVVGSGLWSMPSYALDVPGAPPPERPGVTRLVVRGVSCVDTARRAMEPLERLPGVTRVVAYASRHTLEVFHDGARVDAQAIRKAVESPRVDPATGEIRFQVYKVLEID